ncbi:PREDICTED: zinc finger MYM-type protein 1-like [Amphimedon queenslandica]|nr:PREDICTED: zinc finger MYM-type protein 1-like [Amphimedon queenslandica]|eukprot:XP_011404754.1 PREDICTED: zinc finger MYM-type protein 1-like [Amphimedon queenslandica]
MKYYSIQVDATPDSSHMEQTTFILRYVLETTTQEQRVVYEVIERFVTFISLSKKTGSDITSLVLDQLRVWELPLNNCRGQCYDNGANMAGKYKGVQAQILELNKYALFTPCAAHSLNLVGANAAECCPTVTTFFGTVQKLYTFMSGSPQRWEILLECIPCSLHGQSHTRWSERIDAVRQVAAHLPGILQAIESVSKLNLSPEAKVTVDGLHDYFNSFL